MLFQLGSRVTLILQPPLLGFPLLVASDNLSHKMRRLCVFEWLALKIFLLRLILQNVM